MKRHSIDERRHSIDQRRRMSRSDGFVQTILPPDYEKRTAVGEHLPSLPPGFSRPMTPESEAALEGFQEDATCRLDGTAEKMLKVVPLTLWLEELGLLSHGGAALALRKQHSEGDLTRFHGVPGDLNLGLGGLLVRGKASFNHYNTDPLPVSAQRRARLDRAFVEHLARIAQERDLRPMGDVSEELQIFRLKLHDRQARRRFHDIFGAKRRPRRVPEPVFANVVAEVEKEPPKVTVKEVPIRLPSFDDVLIPSKPKPVIVDAPVVQDVVTPQAVAQTPPAARKPWTPKTRQEEEPEEPEPTPVVVPDEPDDPEIEVSKPKPPPPAPTPQASPKKQASRPEPTSMPAATEPEKVPVAAVVQCGLFRIKDEAPNLGMAFYSSPLLFPALKEERQSEVPKSPEEVEEDYERPASEGLSSTRPPSQSRRRRFNLAEEFREAIALAWERALAEVELVWAQKHPVELEGLERIHQLIGMGKDDGKDCEELPEADSLDETCVGESRSLEQEEEEDDASDGEATALEDAQNQEAMDQFFTVFKRSNSVGSQESSTLADCVRRVERKRYARQLERRTGSAALERRTQRCWTQRVEVCRRLLLGVDRLQSKASTRC